MGGQLGVVSIPIFSGKKIFVYIASFDFVSEMAMIPGGSLTVVIKSSSNDRFLGKLPILNGA